MRKLLKSVSFFFLFSSYLFAQTILNPTDIILVTINADGADNFDFVPLVDLEAGTIIKFTDIAWDGSALSTNEGIVTYTAQSAVTAGNVVSYSGIDGGGFTATSFAIAAGGDNILVYQGTEANPTFIYGVGWGNSSNWLTSGTPDNSNSRIPSNLSFSKYTIVQLGTSDNYQYNIANGTSANAVDLQALIANESNWNDNSSTAYTALSATFTITSINNLASNVVIAEVYPSGGNSGATYSNDYIVLYNPTSIAVDISGYSIQYDTYNGDWSSISSISLTGSISAADYYVIQGSGGGEGDPLPVSANVSGSMSLSSSGGKLALVSNQTNITGVGDGDVIDFLGYGNANEFEGTVMDDPNNPTSSIRRKDNNGYKTMDVDGSGYDTNDNYFDFYLEEDIATNQPLPVELNVIKAICINNSVKLSWQTATEVNNFGFDVERNSTLLSTGWERVGFVQGHGTSNSPKSYSFIDIDLPKVDKLLYRLKQIDNDGTITYSKVIEVCISTITTVDIENLNYKFELHQNYPNPFNPITTISYTLPNLESGQTPSPLANLIVFNSLGQEVMELVNEDKPAGEYSVQFNASLLPSGIYFYKLSYSRLIQVRKLVLLK